MSAARHTIGLISGTSVDAVDAVVARFDDQGVRLMATHSHAPPADLRRSLLELSDDRVRLSLAEFGRLDQAVGAWFAEAAEGARRAAGLERHDIAAIGSHGQTVWHAPDAEPAFSLQIGSPSRIAARTGCPVVSDFRNADIAIGGQGAPLVCALHAALFGDVRTPRAVVNVGGIANVTLLPAGAQADTRAVTGFDTGPGNGLMDAWIHHHRGAPYDADGAWAASAEPDTTLLDRLLADPYFMRRPPKSTGRETFGLAWLQAHVDALDGPAPTPVVVQATLCELTARTIVDALAAYGPDGLGAIYLCGGGVHNHALVARIQALAGSAAVHTTDTLGVDPDWVEALAFAWLAHRRLIGAPGNAPGVTGARQPTVLGGLHLPPPG